MTSVSKYAKEIRTYTLGLQVRRTSLANITVEVRDASKLQLPAGLDKNI